MKRNVHKGCWLLWKRYTGTRQTADTLYGAPEGRTGQTIPAIGVSVEQFTKENIGRKLLVRARSTHGWVVK